MALPEHPTFNSGSDQNSGTTWPDGTVWHYTTGSGLAGLVSGKVLWASAMAFMNDSQEMHTGQDIFKKLLESHSGDVEERIRGDFDAMVRRALHSDRYRTYIACASRQPDRLTMWRNYTGEVGYAVALDGRKELRMRRQQPFTDSMFSPLGIRDDESKQILRDLAGRESAGFAWAPAVYKPEDQYEAAWAALRGVEAAALARSDGKEIEKHELYAMADVGRVLSTLKNPSFEDEDEIRLVCSAGMHVDRMYLKHRPGSYGMIPYVELGLPVDPAQELGEGPEPMKALPITGVVVGPTRYPDEARIGVVELLRSHGYSENLPVIASRIPFRP